VIGDEQWLPVPNSPGYEVSSAGNVRSLDRIVIKSNGVYHTVAPRTLRIGVEPRSGLRCVKLCTGRAGRYRTVYIHRLVGELFGEAPANNGHPPASNG
jgi:hypothetical protein